MMLPVSDALTTSSRPRESAKSASRIMTKNSPSRVCEMSTILTPASARTREVSAMMPVRLWPTTVTMMRLDLFDTEPSGARRTA